ncbi:MAG: hypothetical protein ACXQS8_01015, partial [Candidatus Helarchaeales archaeon]
MTIENAEASKIQKQEKVKSLRIRDKDSILSFFPLRLGIFTIIFLAFFFITALFLYIVQLIFHDNAGTFDLFQIFLLYLRIPTLIYPFNLVYSIIVPPNLVNQQGLEAIYISTSLILSFFTVSLLCSIDKIRHFIFRQSRLKSTLVQIGIFLLLFSLYLHVFDFIYALSGYSVQGLLQVNFISIFIIVIAEIAWLFIQTWSLLSFARKFATDAEGYVSSHESKLAYIAVRTAPLWCIAGIFLFSLGIYILVGLGTIFGIVQGKTLNFFLVLVTLFVCFLCFIPLIITARTPK